MPVVTNTLRVIDYAILPEARTNGVATGQDIAPLIPMTAPTRSGVYVTTWRMYAPNNRAFGPEFTYTVEVGAEAIAAPPPRGYVDWWFVVPAVIGVLLGLIQAGEFVARMYSLRDVFHGVQFACLTTFGLPLANWWATARNGELEGAERVFAQPSKLKPGVTPPPPNPNEPIYKIGGPGTLSITSETAVVLERGAYYSRMLGPGEYRLRAFERVRAVYDLRIQSFSGTERALTKDGIPAEATVNTQFRFMRRMRDEPEPRVPPPSFTTVLRRRLGQVAVPTEHDPLPVSPEALRLATYELHTNPDFRIHWNSGAHHAISGEVREALSTSYLDDLFAPDDPESHPRRVIMDRLEIEGRATLARRGIELTNSGFGNIIVPPEVTELRRDMWRVIWNKESLITRSGGEAEGYLQTQIARAEAQAELIQSITQAIRTMDQTNQGDGDLHPLILRFMDTIARMVDRTLRESSSDASSRAEMNKVLERLRKALKTDES
jgi:regulator of protease activity HflC (stomatin/prohibitin superfamily)